MTSVGITGHIDISPETRAVIAARIATEVSSLSRPLTGLTSLAPGADQAFAWAVLAAGGDLVFVRPCSQIASTIPAHNLALFEAAANLAELVSMPYEEPSEEAYLAAGLHIADTVDVLFAVWDGKPASGKGGTADIVDHWQRKHGQLPVIFWPPGAARG